MVDAIITWWKNKIEWHSGKCKNSNSNCGEMRIRIFFQQNLGKETKTKKNETHSKKQTEPVVFRSVDGDRPKRFWNDRKKVGHFGQDVWKYRLMNIVFGEFGYNNETNDRNVSAKKKQQDWARPSTKLWYLPWSTKRRCKSHYFRTAATWLKNSNTAGKDFQLSETCFPLLDFVNQIRIGFRNWEGILPGGES